MLEEEDNDYLLSYEKEYHKLYDNEFKAQQNVQNIIRDMTEDDFNYMFRKLTRYIKQRLYRADVLWVWYNNYRKKTNILIREPKCFRAWLSQWADVRPRN